jgi:Ser/Thr protein kinase RdoA (MazF antagonist)
MRCTVDELLDRAGRFLGPVRVVGDRSWPHGESVVLEVVAVDGGKAFVKAHRDPDKFATELRAYREVAPRLGDRVPILLGFDEASRVLVLSAVPGVVATAFRYDPTTHRRAGALLAALHRVRPPRSEAFPGWHGMVRQRLERWIGRAEGWLDGGEVDSARAEVEAAEGLTPRLVPAHWDWQPRNWLVEGDALYAIDFEHLRPDSWIADLQKLWWNEWRDHPELRVAFLAGYGATLDDIDPVVFRALAAVHLVTTIVWAQAHDDAEYAAKARAGLRALMSTTGLGP